MSNYEAVLFDLDDTLLDRNEAVANIFLVILEKCYGDVDPSTQNKMLLKFRKYDKRCYGISDKASVLEALFEEYPPIHRLPRHSIQDFWNRHFPGCFTINPQVVDLINEIKQKVKVAIITNGTVHRQKAKIMNTKLNHSFDTIIISDEVGLQKPDTRIFDLALKELDVKPEAALYVGDDLEKDIGGSQAAKLKGIWFNPGRIKNETEITPDAEIDALDRLLSHLT